MNTKANLRYGVIGVFTDAAGNVLVGERSTNKGSFQFPQGGIDPGEDPETALLREMHEEVGSEDFEVLARGEKLTEYFFPSEANFAVAQNYDGQCHHWFLLQFHQGKGPDLSKSDGEFSSFRWVSVSEALQGIISWKKQAYIEGLRALKLMK